MVAAEVEYAATQLHHLGAVLPPFLCLCLRLRLRSIMKNNCFVFFFLSSIFSQSQATKKISTNNSDQNHVFVLFFITV